MHLPRLPSVIVIIGIFVVVFVECRWYQSGLVFYDLSTKLVILPPTVSVQRGRSFRLTSSTIFSKLGQPCTCKGFKCGCCAGLQVREYNFNQKMCANITFVPDKEEALLDVFLNEVSRAKYGISARNPSPLCIPIMMPLPMAACIQMSDVGLKGDNLHMCMDFVMRLHTTDAMELHFNCLSMGLDGINYLDKNGNPVLPRTEEHAKGSYGDEEGEEDNYYDAEEEDEQIPEAGQKESTGEEEVGQHFEESGDGQNNDDENYTSNAEVEYYEDVDGIEDNEDVDIVTKHIFEHSATTERPTEENYIADNLIRVYETV